MIGYGALVRIKADPLHTWRVVAVRSDGRLELTNAHSHSRVVRPDEVEEMPDADQ